MDKLGKHSIGTAQIAVSGQHPLSAAAAFLQTERQYSSGTVLRQISLQEDGTAHSGGFFIVGQHLSVQQESNVAPKHLQTDCMGAPFQLRDHISIVAKTAFRRICSRCSLIPQGDQLSLIQRGELRTLDAGSRHRQNKQEQHTQESGNAVSLFPHICCHFLSYFCKNHKKLKILFIINGNHQTSNSGGQICPPLLQILFFADQVCRHRLS